MQIDGIKSYFDLSQLLYEYLQTSTNDNAKTRLKTRATPGISHKKGRILLTNMVKIFW